VNENFAKLVGLLDDQEIDWEPRARLNTWTPRRRKRRIGL
tara:strand:+ start:346 stop:465 length:120 start_codon:yes stop_codon:yes gene_type:complete